MYKVLLVDDSVDFQLMVKQSLLDANIDMDIAGTLETAQHLIQNNASHPFDLILLDFRLPDGNGFALLNYIQTHESLRETPVFFLTGSEELSHKVTAFELGADDYLVKPVHPSELKARIEMRLRKSLPIRKSSELLVKGDLILETSILKASIRKSQNIQQTLDLTNKEFKILFFLAHHENQVYSRAQLVKSIWGDTIHVTDRTIDSHICGIRKKLQNLADYIESIPGEGYRFSSLKHTPNSITK
jgi:DNA-binding response OmpR family regulator